MAGKALPAKVFDCPSCGSGVVIRAQGLSISVICRSCGSTIDTANENYQVISKAAQKLKINPSIPLGQRGKLHGVLWEVIGFMMREDGSGIYKWSEYLLFNPMKGFRWLTEFDGHWNYVVQTKENPKLSKQPTLIGTDRAVAHVFGKDYQLFHSGSAKVIYVMGEFYWRVQVGEKVHVEDFILPPEILSSEKSQGEIVWSFGEYLTSDTVKQAFQVSTAMPVTCGVAPNQPSHVAHIANSMERYWMAFVAVIFIIQMFTATRVKKDEVYRGVYSYQVNDPQKQKVTPSFELKHGTSNVDFVLYSNVTNSWLEVEGDLVNDHTGETFEFQQGVEYYSGYDSDGSWTEGSRFSHETLSSIPDGIYHLNLEATGSAPSAPFPGTSSPEQPYAISVTRDVLIWSNFFWALILVSVFPAYIWLRNRSFEQARWSASDFSPYWAHQGED